MKNLIILILSLYSKFSLNKDRKNCQIALEYNFGTHNFFRFRYRVCDLLLAVFNRNGSDFKETILRSLITEVHEAVKRLSEHHFAGISETGSKEESFISGDLASKASVRIHLFTLLFEECKVLAAKIVDESSIISAMINLLSRYYS